MNHFTSLKLGYGVNTVAYYSIKEPRSLIVFIHGFGGDAISTWKEFPERVYSEPAFSESDIIFYGYDSLSNNAGVSSVYLGRFLEDHHRPANVTINQYRGTGDSFRYSKIIFMAHSLGSIILRRTLLTFIPKRPDWLTSCKMILFAPAHMGAKVLGVLEAVPDWGKFMTEPVMIFLIKSLHDLKEQSTAINALVNDTNRHLGSHPEYRSILVAEAVIWCKGDNVVNNTAFCEDPAAEPVDPTTHVKVCKPDRLAKYDKPFNVLKQVL